MTSIDPVISSLFQVRHLALALRCGHPYEAACAMAVEVGYASVIGDRGRERTERIATAAQALVQRAPEPYPRALLAMCRGFAAMHVGRWQDSLGLFERAEEILRNECVGVSYEITLTQSHRLVALFFAGRIRELSGLLAAGVIEARERDDMWAEVTLSSGPQNIYWLAQDDIDRARGDLVQASSRWSEGGYAVQRLWSFIANLHIDLYAAEGLTAWRRLSRRWDSLTRSYVFEAQWYRVIFHYLRACAALAVLRGGKGVIDRDGLQGLIAEDIRALAHEKALWARPLADLVSAGLASVRGQREATVSALRSAEKGFRAVEMSLHAAVARRLAGLLLGGEQGDEMVLTAEAFMAEQGVQNPTAISRMFAPGVQVTAGASSSGSAPTPKQDPGMTVVGETP